MTTEPAETLIARLDALLDSERAALLGGKLERLAPIMQQKNALIDGLAALEGSERETLAAVRNKAERNQVLFDSAMEGVRAVADRMADLRNVRSGLATYDSSGRRAQSATGTRANVEKRA